MQASSGRPYERVKSGLSDPIVMAFFVLNHKWWPDVVFKQDKPDYLQLDMYVLHEISLIIESYRKFFADVTGKQVVDEWTAIKRMVVQNAFAHEYAVQATVGTHAEHVHRALPAHAAFKFGGHCH